jgi:hypothetical protein
MYNNTRRWAIAYRVPSFAHQHSILPTVNLMTSLRQNGWGVQFYFGNPFTFSANYKEKGQSVLTFTIKYDRIEINVTYY